MFFVKLMTDRFSGRVMQSGRCVRLCVRALTFDRHLARWFIYNTRVCQVHRSISYVEVLDYGGKMFT